MTKSVLIFHGNCVDGAFSAAVALRALKARGEGEPLLVPAAYQRSLENYVGVEQVRGAVVYVLDFSFPPDETFNLSCMVGEHGKVIVVDHHDRQIKKFSGWKVPPNVELVFDVEHSGAVLTWKRFYPADEDVSAFLRYVEDYDLWQHRISDSKAVHAYLRSIETDPLVYVKLLDDLEDEGKMSIEGAYRHVGVETVAVVEGRAILRANLQQAQVLASKPETVHFAGITALAANTAVHVDDVGDMLASGCADGVGVTWYWHDGKYKVSLRSRSSDGREKVDVSAIAARYGGGGHAGAAGFSCQELPWRRPPTFAEMAAASRPLPPGSDR